MRRAKIQSLPLIQSTHTAVPPGLSTLHGRVSKPSANSKSLNVSNIVALKSAINPSFRGQLQKLNNTLT